MRYVENSEKMKGMAVSVFLKSCAAFSIRRSNGG